MRADPYDRMPGLPSFTLTSEDIAVDVLLPLVHVFPAAGGQNRSPQLSWHGFPHSTASFGITCFDPDAPTESGFWHWALYGVPASVTSLARGAGNNDSLPSGAFHLCNDFGEAEYGGAAPPQGDVAHRYVFAVYAFDTLDLGIGPDTTPAAARFMTNAHALARATLTVMYQL